MSMNRGSRETTAESVASIASSSSVTSLRAKAGRAKVGDDGNDVRSVASSEDVELIEKLPRYQLERIRRYYLPELNLLDAFETATATDLSHNLFGLSLEKRKRTRASQDTLPEWSSKTRLVNDDAALRIKTFYYWAAWPRDPNVHGRSGGIESGTGSKVETSTQIQPKGLDTTRADLEDVLASVAMRLAREAMSNCANPADTPNLNGVDEESRLPLEVLVFSADEDKCTRLLKPLTANGRERIENLFANLKPVGQHNQAKLMDWKHVLQLATDLRWEDRVITATKERCTAMFGEEFSGIASSRHEQLPSQAQDDNSLDGSSGASLQPEILAEDDGDVEYEM